MRAPAILIVFGLVFVLSSCATLKQFAERLCSLEVVHLTFCDGPEEPEGEE